MNLETASTKRKGKEYPSIFSVFCHCLNFFPAIQAVFLPDCVHLLIDNWLQSHSGLLKYQARASGFRPRPQAPLLSVSGRLAPLEPFPVSPIQPGCFVYLHLCRLPATHRVRLGGADRVSVLTSSEERQVDSTQAQAPVLAASLKSLPFLTLLTHLLSPMVLALCSSC